MGKLVNISGKRFGRLEVVKHYGIHKTKSGQIKHEWLCKCDCGNMVVVQGARLKNGMTSSCGCYREEQRRMIHRKPNEYKILGSYATIVLEDGNETMVDIDDLDFLVNLCRWNTDAKGYVRGKTKNGLVSIHRLVSKVPDNMVVDHINHNLLDNRKCNLRICSGSDNAKNKKIPKNNTSGVLGVYYIDKSKSKKWRASIGVNGKTVYIGQYKTKEEAIEARQKAECDYFGEFRFSKEVHYD